MGNGQLVHTDFVIETVKQTGAMTVVEIAKTTGVRVNDVVSIVMAEDGKRLRQTQRRRVVIDALWEAM